jgi:cobalt/nickel transport system permease protein
LFVGSTIFIFIVTPSFQDANESEYIVMHMADALISPVVGSFFWAVSSALTGYSAKKISEENDFVKTPLMGVLGAFVFAAQMINFTIPGTGASGHLGGGLLLAILLGPHRAFITLASVLFMQCLFFADGGILALGCNIFNLAFIPAFVAYPLVYRVIAGTKLSPQRIAAGSITAATAALLMGAFSVVLQTMLSAITELPFSTFMLFMLPIHLAIALVEGLVTWAVLSFVLHTEPALLSRQPVSSIPRFTLVLFTVAALTTGGVVSWFASSSPDGLEWSMAQVHKSGIIKSSNGKVHDIFARLQNRTAFLPDYAFRVTGKAAEKPSATVSEVDVGKTVSGVTGALSVLIAAGTAGVVLEKKRPKQKRFL